MHIFDVRLSSGGRCENLSHVKIFLFWGTALLDLNFVRRFGRMAYSRNGAVVIFCYSNFLKYSLLSTSMLDKNNSNFNAIM